jgi:hypothetical protein
VYKRGKLFKIKKLDLFKKSFSGSVLNPALIKQIKESDRIIILVVIVFDIGEVKVPRPVWKVKRTDAKAISELVRNHFKIR